MEAWNTYVHFHEATFVTHPDQIVIQDLMTVFWGLTFAFLGLVLYLNRFRAPISNVITFGVIAFSYVVSTLFDVIAYSITSDEGVYANGLAYSWTIFDILAIFSVVLIHLHFSIKPSKDSKKMLGILVLTSLAFLVHTFINEENLYWLKTDVCPNCKTHINPFFLVYTPGLWLAYVGFFYYSRVFNILFKYLSSLKLGRI